MEFIDLVKERYSCKNFANLALDRDDLERVLEAGRLAPTAKNNQPQRIYVAESKKALAIIDEHTPCRYGAPTVLVVAFDKDLSLIHISEPTRRHHVSRMPSSA